MAELLGEAEVWVAIAFVIFCGIMIWLGYGRIVAALDRRAETIAAELDEARNLREEAQSLLADYQRKKRDAEKEAENIITNAQEEAGRASGKAEADLEAAIERRTQIAMEKIASAEAQALEDVRNTTADVAVDAARDLIASTLDDKKTQELVDTAVAELDTNLH